METATSDPLVLSFTVVFHDSPDGGVTAQLLERPAAISQGRTRAEARDNIRDALRELLLHDGATAAAAAVDAGDDLERLQLTIAP